MYITKQLSIFLDNRPGTLAQLADVLGAAGINILAISTSDSIDHTVMRIVVSDHLKAIQVFKKHGIPAVEHDVLVIEGSHNPGSLAKLAHCLGAAKVNIDYCYSATSMKEKRGLMVLRLSDAKKALKVLGR